MELRGGSNAPTEEEEAAAANVTLGRPEDTTVDGGDKARMNESAIEQFVMHLEQVDNDPASFLPCPQPGCFRFFKLQSNLSETCECQSSLKLECTVSETFSTPARNLWRRFYPLDLAAFVPSVVDSEDLFGEEAEAAQARASLFPSAPRTLPAPASQRLKLRNGGGAVCHVLLANESGGVLAWTLEDDTHGERSGQRSVRVERVLLSPQDSNGSVTVTWTSARLCEDNEASRDAARDDPAEVEACVAVGRERTSALRRLKTLLGCGAPLRIPFMPADQADPAQGDVKKEEEEEEREDKEEEEEERFGSEGAEVLDVDANAWVPAEWKDLVPGQVVRVNKTKHFPADLLLLHASTPSEVCVETSCIDGDGALRHWQVAPMRFGPDPAAEGAELAALGSGDKTHIQALRGCGHFLVAPSRLPSEWESWWARFVPREGDREGRFGYRQLLIKNGRLLVTEWVVGLVLFTGRGAAFALNGGWRGHERQAKRRKEAEAKEEARKAEARQRQLQALSEPVLPADYERDTGVRWQSRFVDVPDDGNCLMHAVWLGLRTLLRLYPHLKAEGEAELAGSAVQFRADALSTMAKDKEYREGVRNTLSLWLSVDCELLFGLEDFFCLPPEFQSAVVELNQQVQMGGRDLAQVDLDSLVDQYVQSLSQVQEDSGRPFYLPLGDLELSALCRIFRFRLQVVKTEALDSIREASDKTLHTTPLPPEVVEAVTAVTKENGEEAWREALGTTLLFVHNIIDNPSDPKFCTIKESNPAFQRRVASKPKATDLLVTCGFERAEAEGQRVLQMAKVPDWLPAAARHMLQTLHPGESAVLVDPRTIRTEHIYDRNKEMGRRVVRILNVRTNHYQVHLPRAPNQPPPSPPSDKTAACLSNF